MEIIVEGTGKSYFTPNKVIMDLRFYVKGDTYEEVLKKGTNYTNTFLESVILKNGFTKENLKTRNFIIRKEIKYNEDTRKEEEDGYSYTQNAKIEFTYDLNKVSKMMEEIANLDTQPYCYINFGLDNDKECRKEALSLAFKDAEEKAQAIATTAGKTLNHCAKVDFKSNSNQYYSHSSLSNELMCAERSIQGGAQSLSTIFTPEDIEITESLTCKWIVD